MKKSSKVLNTLKILWKMEHLLQKSKYSIFHNIFKYMIFQRHQKVILWGKGLRVQCITEKYSFLISQPKHML